MLFPWGKAGQENVLTKPIQAYHQVLIYIKTEVEKTNLI